MFVVFLIGLFSHLVGYILNDIADIEVDKKSTELKQKPLVSGRISKKNALLIAIIGTIITYLLTIYYFPYIRTLLILIVVTFLAIIYNFYGKKIPGSDFIVAGTVAIFCLFGASTVNEPFSNLIYFVCLVLFFDVVFINVVEGGLKDVDHDYLSGAKTLATVAGVKVREGELFITKKFLTFAYSIRIIYILMIILLGFDPEIDIWLSNNYVLIILVIILMFLVLFSSAIFLHQKVFDRSKMKKIYGGINAATGVLLIVMVYPIIGWEIALFLIIYPVIWYSVFNKMLYGKAYQPGV